jgi:hypothetical protein
VTKHNISMSLRKSGHRGGVGNPSTPAEEDVKVYIYIIRICCLKPACENVCLSVRHTACILAVGVRMCAEK